MKVCPICKTQYTDDSLTFCLQDGSRLVEQGGFQTVAIDDSETVVRSKDSDANGTRRPSEVTQVSSLKAEKRGSRAPFLIAGVVVIVVLIFGIIGLGSLMLYRNWPGPSNNASPNVAGLSNGTNSSNSPLSNLNRTTTPLSSPTPIFSNTNSVPISTPTPDVTNDPEADRREVSQRVFAWKSATESQNVGALMRNYAGTVDYYRRAGVSASVVRNDKQRAFSMFSSIRMAVSNVNVQVDASVERATAIFDKEWVFQGARVTSGKVQSQLQFRKISGEWLITGERDLKVYYLNR